MVKKSGRHHLSQITEEMTASQVLAPEQFMPFSRTFGASFNAGMETKQNQQGSPYAKNMWSEWGNQHKKIRLQDILPEN